MHNGIVTNLMQRRKVSGVQTKSVGKHMAKIRNDESAGLYYNPRYPPAAQVGTGMTREIRDCPRKAGHSERISKMLG
jgi:hypothetical protein